MSKKHIEECVRESLQGYFRDLGGEDVRDGMRVRGIGDRDHLADAGDLRSLRRDRVGRVGQHDDVDAVGVQRLGAGDAARRRAVELAVEVFGDDQDLAHVIP